MPYETEINPPASSPHFAARPGGPPPREAFAEVREAVRRWPVLAAGFRSFFLLAGIWSVLAMLLWTGMIGAGLALPTRFDAVSWHIHAMLYGFIPAVIAGFLLTAIANWTGRAPVNGVPLAALVALWLAARVAGMISLALPFWCAPALDAAFYAALCALAARELLAAGAHRNLFLLAPLVIIAAGSLLMHAESLGTALPAGLSWRLGIAAMVLLMSIIGGRIIPAFTRNWLAARGAQYLPAPSSMPNRLAIFSALAAMVCWAIAPSSIVSGGALAAAGVLALARLARWRGLAVRGEALLLILHAGMAWLALGLILLGASVLAPGAVPLPAGVHALTAGAMGTLTLAVMTRATLGHTGRKLHADAATQAIYLLVTAAALLRVCAGFVTDQLPLLTAGTLWSAAFLLFTLFYAPALLGARQERKKGVLF